MNYDIGMNNIVIQIVGKKTIYSKQANGKSLLTIIREEYKQDAGEDTIVKVESGTASPITDKEKRMLTPSLLAEGMRLASETYPMGNLSFVIDE